MPMEQVVLFEDSEIQNLSPITDIIPMQEVVIGGSKQYLRFDRELNTKTRWIVRTQLEGKVPSERKPDYGDPALLVNSRLISIEIMKSAGKLDFNEALVEGKSIIAAKVKALDHSFLDDLFNGRTGNLKAKPCEALLAKNLWDISPNSTISYLSSDLLKSIESEKVSKPSTDNIRVIGKFPASISEDVEILGPITVDAREGPVVIREGTVIEPYAYLKGPLHIGPHAVIVVSSRIAGSYIGAHGRIGGEVTTSIVSDYSNKYHLGFLGHSYVGRWVNIGAGSITSNLKNTYGEIKVSGRPTGLNKVGAFIGDHSKLSIGTLTYAGIRVGTASHLHGLVYEDVPPFTIYAKSIGWGLYELDLDSVIRTYRRMAPRRGVKPDPIEEKLLRKLFRDTESQRLKKNIIRGRLKVK